MSVHTISGILIKDAVIRTSSGREAAYLELYVQDRTIYNREANPTNTYRALKYASEDELKKEINELKAGTPVFLSGIGLFNSRRRYNIIIRYLEKQEHLSVEIIEKQEQQPGYYERLLYEEEI